MRGLDLALGAVAGLAIASLVGAGGRGAMNRLPRHLRFLEDLADASHHKSLASYFPESARGKKHPRAGEQVFDADGVGYVGPSDGTMVPIDAEYLEPMEENEFDAGKFSALVDAIRSGMPHNLLIDPGYADLWLDDAGNLTAQVRDGNHRTFAPIVAGGSMSWVWLSDRMRQDLNDPSIPDADRLYRAIRKAQRMAGVPLFTRRKASKLSTSGAKVRALLAAERRMEEADALVEDYHRTQLRRWGKAVAGFDLREQLERPSIFWRMRRIELREEHGAAWLDAEVNETPEARANETVHAERMRLVGEIGALRSAAGLKHGERLDPATGKVVRR